MDGSHQIDMSNASHSDMLYLKNTFDAVGRMYLVLSPAPEAALFGYIHTKQKLSERVQTLTHSAYPRDHVDVSGGTALKPVGQKRASQINAKTVGHPERTVESDSGGFVEMGKRGIRSYSGAVGRRFGIRTRPLRAGPLPTK